MRRAGARALLGWAIAGLPGAALAQSPSLPAGGAYIAGSGSIATAGPAMTITQSSARGIIDWQGFSIGPGNRVRFDNGAGATLNRVTGADLSTIAGALSASGSVYLINPNGIVIGPGGKIVTGGSFVAATRDVANSQFMAGGSLTFSGASSGTVTNAGRIVSRDGDVVLIGDTATNSGSIEAPKGTATLAAGNEVVLSAASGPAGVPAGIYVAPDPNAKGNATNSGRIEAAAAELASAGGNVYALAGNRAGLIEATGTRTVAGQVWLTAPNGTVSVTGTVAARNADGSGGTIVADGSAVALDGTARLLATGTHGGTVLVGVTAPGGVAEAASTSIAGGAVIEAGGTAPGTGGHIETWGRSLTLGAADISAGPGGSWVLDPTDITIDAAAASTISTSLDSGSDVTEETSAGGTGNITVASPISWDSAATLTLSAFNSVIVGAAITATGNGSLAIVTNNNDGGTSSGGTLAFTGGDIQFTTPGEGALSIDGTAYTLIQSMAELRDVGSSGNYALAVDLDASGTSGFTPIGGGGTDATPFNGLGNTIANLTISAGDIYVGLFGQVGSGGVVENLGLLGGSVTGTLFGGDVGGLVGWNDGGTIENAYTTGTVTESGEASNVGGLVGRNQGGTIENAYATGTVSSGNTAGGLVGYSYDGAITDAYATGAVSGAILAGGLVAYNGGTIEDTYATGTVSGGIDAGGLVGLDYGTDTDAYWNEDRNSSTTTGIGTNYFGTGSATGLSGTDVFTASEYNGFTFTTTPGTQNAWVMADTDGTLNNASGAAGGTMPMLASEYTTSIVNAHQLQLMAMDPTASYTLAANIDASATGSSTSATTGTDVWGSAGFIPVGQGAAFTGTFNGADDAISGLTIASSAEYVGLFGEVGSGRVVENLGLLGGSVTGNAPSGYPNAVGGLAGENIGTIEHAYATSTVSGSYSDVGGLVGYNVGTITDAYATGTVSSNTGYFSDVGGLVEISYGNGATIEDAYATGAVSATDTVSGSGSDVGGLAGYNGGGGTIEDAYATGAVGGSGAANYIGGLVGYDAGGTYSGDYFDASTTGADADAGNGALAGVTGLATGQFLTEGPIATGAWSTATWVAGYPYPVLKALPYILVSADGTLTYGSSSPAIGIAGIADQNGNDASGLVDTADIAWLTDVSATSNVGAYVIGGTGATASPGYQLTYIGTLTVDPAPLTIAADDATKTYGETLTLDGYSVSGLVNGDSVAGVVLISAGAVATANAGSYATVPGTATGSSLSNYAVTYLDGTLTVDPAVLTAGLTGSVTKTYDGTTAATLTAVNYTLTGVIGADRVSHNDPASGVYATSAVGTGILVSVGGLVLLGPDAGNYVLADPSVTADIGVITPAPVAKPAPLAQPAPVLLPSPIPPLPVLLALPQPVPTAGPGALLLMQENGLGPLPAIIAREDAAGLVIGPAEIAFSTGLPLAAGAEQALVITGRGRHLRIILPPRPHSAPLEGGF